MNTFLSYLAEKGTALKKKFHIKSQTLIKKKLVLPTVKYRKIVAFEM